MSKKVLLFIIVFAVLLCSCETKPAQSNEELYVQAGALFNEYNYIEAKPLYEQLNGYKDSKTYLDYIEFYESLFGYYTYQSDNKNIIIKIGETTEVLNKSSKLEYTNVYISMFNDNPMLIAYNDYGEYDFIIINDSVQFRTRGYTILNNSQDSTDFVELTKINKTDEIDKSFEMANSPIQMYEQACNLYNDSKFESAKSLLEQIGDYGSSLEMIDKICMLESMTGSYEVDTSYWFDEYDRFEIGETVTSHNKSGYVIYEDTYFGTLDDYNVYVAKNNIGWYAFMKRGTGIYYCYCGDVVGKFTKTRSDWIRLEKHTGENDPKKSPAIGMTAEEVRNSTWGSPDKINTTITANTTYEQWCYSNNRYIYFENGIVTAIQK